MPINSNKAELSSCQIKISPEHMKVLRDDLDSKDDRALKEIVAFLIVFGEPLHKSLENEIRSQRKDVLAQCWDIACDIGGAFSEKLRAFGCVGFEPNFLSWNHLIFSLKDSPNLLQKISIFIFLGAVFLGFIPSNQIEVKKKIVT